MFEGQPKGLYALALANTGVLCDNGCHIDYVGPLVFC